MERASRVALLTVLAAGTFLVGVELIVTAVALPAILGDLADWTALRRASWIVNGYLLAYIATMPLAGRAADRFGLPKLFGLSLLTFAVGSVLSGASQTLEQLIAARVVQGAGGGALVPLATAGASHLFEGAARARALGVVAAATFLGMAAGPFAGAAVLESFDLGPLLGADHGTEGALLALATPAWRWIFYLGAPFALLSAVYVWAATPDWRVIPAAARLDVVGAALFTASLAAGLVALTTLGSEDPVEAMLPLPAAALAVVAALLSLVHARRVDDPFLEPRFFRNGVFRGAVLISLLTGYALATAIVGGAVFVDRVRYGGPDDQRLALGALAGAMALGALVSGQTLRWLGFVPLTMLGLTLGSGGLALLAWSGPATVPTSLAIGLALFGLGFGLTVTPRSVAAVEALGRRAYGAASAAVTVARMIGMAVGLAVLTFLGSNRIEALSVVLTDAAARDAVLPTGLRGRTLQDGLVVDFLERWASEQAAGILAGLFAAAAVVMVLAAVPALALHGGRTTPDAPGRHTARLPPAGAEREDESEAALAL